MVELDPPKKGGKVIASAYVAEAYPNSVEVYTIYVGGCDPIFVAAYRDVIWGSGEDPLAAVYDAAKKWDAKHFPQLRGNPFRQVLEPIASSSPPPHSRSSTHTPDYPRTRDDDARHPDPHEEQLYGD